MKKSIERLSNTRYISTQRSVRGPTPKIHNKTNSSSSRSLLQDKKQQNSSTQLIDRGPLDPHSMMNYNPLDNKIQALLDQNKLLNEKLMFKITTDQQHKLTMSDDIDLSWSTPRLLEEDDIERDFSINVGSCIKKNSISGETLKSIFARMIQLEQIIEDQNRTIAELKEIYKENILNTDIVQDNKKLVNETVDLKRRISVMSTKIARYQEFEQNIEPQIQELAAENQKLNDKLSLKTKPDERIRVLEQEIKSLRNQRTHQQDVWPAQNGAHDYKIDEGYNRILTPLSLTNKADQSYLMPRNALTPNKQFDKYQTDRSSELLKRLNTLSQNLIICAKTIK